MINMTAEKKISDGMRARGNLYFSLSLYNLQIIVVELLSRIGLLQPRRL